MLLQATASERSRQGSVNAGDVLKKVAGGMDGNGQHTGSRNPDGNVPNVNWNRVNRKLKVNYYNPDNRNDNMRSRAEVSPKGAYDGSF